MPSILERIQARIELFRLEQRYTRRRHRRSAFVSNAVYVDGEYIYNTPATTGSSGYTSGSGSSQEEEPPLPNIVELELERQKEERQRVKEAKRMNRWSSMPGFGSLGKAAGREMPAVEEWRPRRGSFGDAR